MDKWVNMFGRGRITGLAATLADHMRPTDMQHMKNMLKDIGKFPPGTKWDEQSVYNVARYLPDVAKLIISRTTDKKIVSRKR